MEAVRADLETLQVVEDLIYESCLMANAEDWAGYLDLCDKGLFRYRIMNYSPEIRREQSWMIQDFKGMKTLFELLPKHNSDHSTLTRHATVQKVRYDPEKDEMSTVALVTIYRTQVDGTSAHFDCGKTSLFAVARYEDRIKVEDGLARLLSRTVRLDTRQLDIGSHYPF